MDAEWPALLRSIKCSFAVIDLSLVSLLVPLYSYHSIKPVFGVLDKQILLSFGTVVLITCSIVLYPEFDISLPHPQSH